MSSWFAIARKLSKTQFIGLTTQSARQIWVWPNPKPQVSPKPDPASFNLPGRFGFGRTAAYCMYAARRVKVSICQADLGLAELWIISTRSVLVSRRFNLPGRFGFGRTWHWIGYKCRKYIVSICQADLGLAELPVRYNSAIESLSGFNLPGRFGFGRTFLSAQSTTHSPKFQSARQIWVWPNRVMPISF